MLLLLLYALYRLVDACDLRMGLSVTALLLVFFWTAYSLRFIADAAFIQLQLGSLPAADMATYLFAVCLPTFIVLYLIRNSAVQKGAYVEHAFVGCVQSGFDASD